MTVRVHSVVGVGLLALGLAAAVGCGRTSPVSPTAVSTPAAQAAVPNSASAASQPANRKSGGTDITNPLLAGSFEIANTSGDSIKGTYTGTVRFAPGAPERVSLTLVLTGGTGVFAGASGSIGASGLGAFASEGAFTLDIRGDALLEHGKHAQITANISGTSSLYCTATAQIAVTQTGDGTMGRAGRVHGTFSHEVGNADCIAH